MPPDVLRTASIALKVNIFINGGLYYAKVKIKDSFL